MYKELYDLLYDYSKRRKVLDNKGLKKALLIIKNYKGLEDFIKKVEIFQKDGNTLASYLITQKSIKIDTSLIMSNSSKDYFSMNLNILVALLHECEHANQMKKISKDYIPREDEKLEVQILKYSFNYLNFINKTYDGLGEEEKKYLRKLGIDSKNKFVNYLILNHKNNYYIDPSERMAQIYAFKTIKNMLSIFDNKSENNLRAGELYENELLRGYSKHMGDLCYNSPTYQFLRNLRRSEEISKLHTIEDMYKDSLSIDKRFELGIHVDDKEIIKRKIKSGK